MASDKFIAPENGSSSNGSTGFFTDAQLANFSQEQLINLLKVTLISQNRLQAEVDKKAAEIDHLNEVLKKYRDMIFGTSSEKGFSKKFQMDGQLAFVVNAANELEITAEQQDDNKKAAKNVHVNGYDRSPNGTKPRGKKEADLSAIENQIEVDDALPDEILKKEFPNGYSVMIKGTYSVVEVIPSQAVRVIHHVLSYKSKGDDKKILTAPHDDTLLNNSIITPSYIAAAVNAKFGNYIPLNHYRKILECMKVFVSTHDLCNQLITVGERYCQGLYDRMVVHLHDAHVLNVDETPCVVRHVEDKDKKTKRAKCYTWVYRTGKFESGPQIVVYKFEKSRAACNPGAFLADFHDKVCVTDGLSDYHTLDEKRADLTFAGCWVHARRKFTDAVKVSKAGPNQTIAGEAVKKIDEIFGLERELKDLSPEERLQKRQQNIKPLVDDFFSWVKGIQNQVLSSSKTGEAIGYAKNQEQFLRVFLTDGQVPLDNNSAELGCRSYVLGRKNWYVIDTPRGADMTALYYTLTETAKLNHLNPYKWYTWFLTEMMHHRDKLNDPDFLDSFMPWSDSIPDDVKVPTEPEPVPVEKKTKGHKAHKLSRPIEEITASES